METQNKNSDSSVHGNSKPPDDTTNKDNKTGDDLNGSAEDTVNNDKENLKPAKQVSKKRQPNASSNSRSLRSVRTTNTPNAIAAAPFFPPIVSPPGVHLLRVQLEEQRKIENNLRDSSNQLCIKYDQAKLEIDHLSAANKLLAEENESLKKELASIQRKKTESNEDIAQLTKNNERLKTSNDKLEKKHQEVRCLEENDEVLSSTKRDLTNAKRKYDTLMTRYGQVLEECKKEVKKTAA